jgi:hypothetical protein
VLNSAYGSHVLSGLSALGVPAATGRLAGQSVVAGMTVASHFPAPLRDAAQAAVRSAFMIGIHRGSLVAAGTALAGALVALVFLPAHAAESEDLVLVAAVAADFTAPSMTQSNA